MRKSLVLMSILTLGAGISRAQEVSLDPAEAFSLAIAQAVKCPLDIETDRLDTLHNIVLRLPENTEGKKRVLKALRELTSDSPRYVWVMKVLKDKIFVTHPTETTVMIDVHHAERADYDLIGINVFQLQELEFHMEQKLLDGVWLTESVDMEIRYINRKKDFLRPWRMREWEETHQRHAVKFHCITE